MPFFERASNIAITNGLFSENTYGNVYLGQKADAEALCTIRKTAEQDSAFNDYSSTEDTLKLPTFSKELLLNIGDINSDDASRPTSRSCCFDLAWRLRLLPCQSNAGFMEYGHDIPIENVVARGTCCCGRISRHGLVHLVSRFFQHASIQETSSGGTIITINTTIGRFKCYDIDDRTFIHFDGGTRSSSIAELLPNQDLDHILRITRGQYRTLGNLLFTLEWQQIDDEKIPDVASTNMFGIPDAIMYMPKEKVVIWKHLRDFGKMMLACALRYIDTLQEPESFCSLAEQQKLPNFNPGNLKPETPPERLAFNFYVCRVMSERVAIDMPPHVYGDFAKDCLQSLLLAHQHYRSPLAEHTKLYKTSQERFLRMFSAYRAQETALMPSSRGRTETETMIENELRSLMETKAKSKNIALVVYQVFISVTVYWNAERMLTRCREVPTDWIRFMSAEDDYIYLG